MRPSGHRLSWPDSGTRRADGSASSACSAAMIRPPNTRRGSAGRGDRRSCLCCRGGQVNGHAGDVPWLVSGDSSLRGVHAFRANVPAGCLTRLTDPTANNPRAALGPSKSLAACNRVDAVCSGCLDAAVLWTARREARLLPLLSRQTRRRTGRWSLLRDPEPPAGPGATKVHRPFGQPGTTPVTQTRCARFWESRAGPRSGSAATTQSP